LEYEFLNERGIDEVNMIIAAIEAGYYDSTKGKDLSDCLPMLAHIVGILLLYMTPGEVYCVTVELIRSTREKFESEEIKSMIRWHVPLTDDDRTRLH